MVFLLVVFQHRFIYLTQRYGSTEAEAPARPVLPVVTRVHGGAQTSYYLSPREGDSPQTLWMVFGGNASLALRWASWCSDYPDPHAGFLLLDYPGYGSNPGTPSPDSILNASAAALDSLMHTAAADGAILDRIFFLGHSLGAAAALQLAVRRPPRGLLLLSPFTDMMTMARKKVGWPLCCFLRHRFDNVARLAELAQAPARPHVHIVHGENDDLIPARMGRELAALYQGAQLTVIPGGDHNEFLSADKQLIQSMMLRLQDAGP